MPANTTELVWVGRGGETRRLLERGFKPDVVTDPTSAHDPLGGYVTLVPDLVLNARGARSDVCYSTGLLSGGGASEILVPITAVHSPAVGTREDHATDACGTLPDCVARSEQRFSTGCKVFSETPPKPYVWCAAIRSAIVGCSETKR